jgi:ribosome biogenesis GTPase
LWDADEGVSQTFSDVEALVAQCRFGDCAHRSEPGCAVRAALDDGSLDAARFEAYGKLQREMAFEARKEDPRLRAETRKVWIRRQLNYRAQKKMRERDD